MNKVILTGRLTKDAEISYASNDPTLCIAKATLAVSRVRRKDDEDQTADFPRIVAFGKRAEFLQQFGKKGVKFDVVGRLQTGSYINDSGVTVYTTDVIIESIEFGESKAANELRMENNQN